MSVSDEFQQLSVEPSTVKYPLPPKVADFAKIISCVIQIKDIPAVIGSKPIGSFQIFFSQNLPPLG